MCERKKNGRRERKKGRKERRKEVRKERRKEKKRVIEAVLKMCRREQKGQKETEKRDCMKLHAEFILCLKGKASCTL